MILVEETRKGSLYPSLSLKNNSKFDESDRIFASKQSNKFFFKSHFSKFFVYLGIQIQNPEMKKVKSTTKLNTNGMNGITANSMSSSSSNPNFGLMGGNKQKSNDEMYDIYLKIKKGNK